MARSKTSRTARWEAAAADLRTAMEAVDEAVAQANDAASALRDVQEEYQDWLDNLPDSLRDSPVGEKLQAVVDIDGEVDDDLEGLRRLADEADGADLPLGWGKD